MAGAFLLFAAVGFIIRSMVFFDPGNALVWLPLGLPFLVAGALFVVANRTSAGQTAAT